MTVTRARVAATALFAVCAAEAVTAMVCGVASGLGWAELNNLLVMSNAAIGLTLGASGWPIAAFRPRNPIGWLLLGGGISYAALSFFLPVALMLFPDGRLPSKRWRPVLLFPAIGAPVLGALGVMSDLSSAVGVSGVRSQPGGARGRLAGCRGRDCGAAVVPGCVGRAAGALPQRQRVGTSPAPLVLLALLVVVVTFVFEPLLPDSTFILLTIALVPMAIAVAVLRNQLLDIRVVFSRSLRWPPHVTALTWGDEALGELVVQLRPGESRAAAADQRVLDLDSMIRAIAAVATRFGLATSTVSNHVSSIFAKLQVATRAEAIVRARDAGL